jgi:hypothetical protein
MTLKETILWLSKKSIEEKIVFNQFLLSDITIMNRAILDNNETKDVIKIESLKWSNELAHRIWNLLFELKRGEDNSSENKLAENINFYRKQSNDFAGHLSASIQTTIERYNLDKGKKTTPQHRI